MTTPYVLSLDDRAAADPAVTGGKAAALATMRAAGLPVPAGFVITAHAFAAVSATLADQIADALATLAGGATAQEVGERLAGLLATARVPANVRAAVRGAYATLAGTALAVRSSATAEDLAGASFAGQYEGFLGITSERLLWRRTRDVWASLHAPRALSYRAARGLAHDDARMAVLVQTLVPARAAGVLFTCDPITGARDRVVINATHGLAEALVSGRSTADVYVLDALTHGVSERTVVDKPLTLRLGADGRVRRARVPPRQRRAPALDHHELAALGALAARVRTLFGDERDVEFALDGDGPRLVQARPVTVVAARPPPFTVHWDDADDDQRFWARMGDEPAYRLEAEIRERATGDMRRSFERTGAPFTRAYLMRHIHGYRYQASPAVDERDVIARQRRWRVRARNGISIAVSRCTSPRSNRRRLRCWHASKARGRPPVRPPRTGSPTRGVRSPRGHAYCMTCTGAWPGGALVTTCPRSTARSPVRPRSRRPCCCRRQTTRRCGSSGGSASSRGWCNRTVPWRARSAGASSTDWHAPRYATVRPHACCSACASGC